MWRRFFNAVDGRSQSRRKFLTGLALGGMAAPVQASVKATPDAELPQDKNDQLWAAVEQQGNGVLSSRAALAGGQVPGTVEQITLLGYHTAGDGGGGLYVRRSNPQSDPASVRSADGAWWTLRPHTGSVSVRQFGAVGDGRADDTDSIRNACAYVQTTTTAHTVTFPSGRYRVTGPIIALQSKDRRLAFRGEDAETTQILLSADLEQPLISLSGGKRRDRVEWVTFSEITFRNANRRFRGDCVHVHKAYHVDWLRCRFIGWNGHAMYLDDYWDSNLDGCRFIGCGSPSEEDAAKGKLPYTGGKAAVWIGSSSLRVTSNNLNFNACQFESSWHNQMRLQDKVRRVHLNSCKFHGNQRANITESQLWVGGAWACKVAACAFAYGQISDHIEFAWSKGALRNRGWTVVGNDFSYSGRAAIRIRDGSHFVINGNVFGQVGINKASIIVEGSVPVGSKFSNIDIAHNVYGPRETAPRIRRPEALSSEVLGHVVLRPPEGSSRAQTVVLPELPTEGAAKSDMSVIAQVDGQDDMVVSRNSTQMKDARSGAVTFDILSNGSAEPFLELDGVDQKVRATQSLAIQDARWDGPHLELGACHLWVDATGALRMKMGAPTGDLDGTVLGT
ncbi:MAG: glycosyl hydrolase family 28-related protein [Pseudomonadota bacterium]